MAEHDVGSAGNLLQDGQMTRLDLEGQAVLLSRVSGKYYAMGAECTHYHGPLNEGVLKDHTVMCPWHHACFDVRNGVRLEPPALNDVPHYAVRIDGDRVKISLPSTNQTEPQGKADSSDSRSFVIVGGGAAGNAAAEELRRSGFKGKITIVSASPDVPVDRPNVSKDYLAGKADPSWMALRGVDWYAERDITLELNTAAAHIDAKKHSVQTDKGAALRYDKLLLATGGIPRQIPSLPGADLKNIWTLRSQADADSIIQAVSKGKTAAVIGASFIGMEVAASLGGGCGATVTVIDMESAPFERTLGADIGHMFQKEHEDNGVKFRLGASISRFVGKGGQVSGVELKSGEVVAADFVVLGIGVRPGTDFLADSGLALDNKDHSVRVDARLQTSDPDIYAAGDIARWDDGSPAGQRIEHWRAAEQQGIVAARNMLGGSERMPHRIPFFWTTQWGITLDYVGHCPHWDEILYRVGKPADKRFLAFYMANGKVAAVAGAGYLDQEMAAAEIILRDALPLTRAQLVDESFDLVKFATQ